MPYQFNFFHQKQREIIERERDPLRLAIYGVILAVAAVLCFHFYYQGQVDALESQVVGKRAALEKKKALAAQSALDLVQYEKSIAQSAALAGAIENRFLWAPYLETLLHSTPPNVQITSMSGRFTKETGIVNVTLTGIVADPAPRIAADGYREQLEKNFAKKYADAKATFTAGKLEDSKATVAYDGKTLPVAEFSIDLKFFRAAAKPVDPKAAPPKTK